MGLVALWHVGSSWNRDRTRVSCIDRQADSLLLSHQGNPRSQISNLGSDLASHLIFPSSDFQFICEWIELESCEI